MQFETFSDFLAMGGHGTYVWLSYALGMLVIVGNTIAPMMQQKKLRNTLLRRFQRENRSK